MALVGTLAVVALTSRWLGGAGYGLFASVTILSTLGALAGVGLPQALVREIAHALGTGDRDTAIRLASSGQALLLGIVGFLAAVATLGAPWLAGMVDPGSASPADVVAAVRLAALIVFLQAASAGPEAVLQGSHRFRTLAVRSMCACAFGWVCLLGAYLSGWGLRGALLSIPVAPAVTLGLNVLAARGAGFPCLRIRDVRRGEIGRLVRFGAPLFVNEAAHAVQSRLDGFLVLIWLPARFLGYYHGAVQLAASALVPPRLLVTAFFPAVAELTAQGRTALVSRGVRRLAGYVVVAVTPFVVGGMFLGDDLVRVVFPGEFAPARGVLPILLLGYGANAMTYPFSAALMGLGHPGAVTCNAVPTALVAVALHVVLIPRLGIEGAAFGTTLALLASASVYPWQTARALRRSGVPGGVETLVPLTHVVVAVAGSVAMLGGLSVLGPVGGWTDLLLALTVGGGAYLAVTGWLLGPDVRAHLARPAPLPEGPLRVAHCVTAHHGGGALNYVVDLVERLDRTRFDPVVFVAEELERADAAIERLRRAEVTVVRAPVRHLYPYGSACRRWTRLLRDHGPFPVAHLHQHVPGAGGAFLEAARWGGSRVLVRTLQLPRFPPMEALSWFRRRWSRDRIDTLGAHPVVVFEGACKESDDELGTCIPTAYREEAFLDVPDRASARMRLGITGNGPVVGFVGSLSVQKRPDLFVATAAALAGQFPDAVFLLGGDGPLRDEVRVAAAPLGDRFRVLGHVDDVPAFLAALDVFVLPSDFEGLPITVLEALRAAVAVVATEVDGTPQVVRHEETGLLVPAGSGRDLVAAVARLLRDRELRESLGARGRELVRGHYDADCLARRSEALYERLLKGM